MDGQQGDHDEEEGALNIDYEAFKTAYIQPPFRPLDEGDIELEERVEEGKGSKLQEKEKVKEKEKVNENSKESEQEEDESSDSEEEEEGAV